MYPWLMSLYTSCFEPSEWFYQLGGILEVEAIYEMVLTVNIAMARME